MALLLTRRAAGGERMAVGKIIFRLQELFTRVLEREIGGAREIFIERMKAPVRTRTKRYQRLAFRAFSTME